MKKNFKFLSLAVASALTFGLASCSSDNDNNAPDNDAKNITIKVEKEATYAEGTPVGTPTINFSKGRIYMVDAGGTIKNYFDVDPSYSATNLTAHQIKTSDLTSGPGVSIINQSSYVANVHIVGNVPASVTLPTTGNISGVTEATLLVKTQTNAANNVADALIYATNGLSGTAPNHTCALTLKPISARIELVDITCSGNITDFKVDGVFINNFYEKSTVAGQIDKTASNLKNFGGSVASQPNFAGTANKYTSTTGFDVLADIYPTPLASVTKVAKPATSGDVWGYNIFPGIKTASPSFTPATPHLVIKLSGVKSSVGGVTYPDPQFITVQTFKQSGTAVTLEAGKVYTIAAGKLAFDEDNLSSVPDPDDKKNLNVAVTVSSYTWVAASVDPELN